MLIGITGKAGSGKDTVANILVENHGFAKVAFADALKQICQDLWRFSYNQLWGPSTSRNAIDTRYPRPQHSFASCETIVSTCACCGTAVLHEQCYLTPRYALQLLGTEYGRHCYPDIWVDAAMGRAAQLLVGNDSGCAKGVVISDVRFPNEASAIKRAGGVIWKARYGHGHPWAGGHESERHEFEVNTTLPSNCPLADLPRVVAPEVEAIMIKAKR